MSLGLYYNPCLCVFTQRDMQQVRRSHLEQLDSSDHRPRLFSLQVTEAITFPCLTALTVVSLRNV